MTATRTTRRLAVLLGATLTLLVLSPAGVSSAAPAPKVVTGTVGPGFTIGLTLAGKKVTRLKAGATYRFVIRDRSSSHDFHLSGPGLNRTLTGVSYTGTKSVVLKLRKGTYRFLCHPHAGSMNGSFAAA